MTNLEYALRYLQKGFSIIPLWSPEMVRKSPPRGYHETLRKELEKNANEENPKPKEKVRTRSLSVDKQSNLKGGRNWPVPLFYFQQRRES